MKNIKTKSGLKRKKNKLLKKIKYQLNIIILINKSLLIIFLFLFIIYTNIKQKIKKKRNLKYFCCFCAIGKMENLYTRELISYYMNIGVDKFIIADNNLPNTEKISDVIKDFIKNNTVDIIDIIGKNIENSRFYNNIYRKYKKKCEWITFFDFDEYLRIHSKQGNIIGLKEYLTNNIFSKCEAIIINWLLYNDNNLIFYDNRTTIERFPNQVFNHHDNKYIKPMIRGNLNKEIFNVNKSDYIPNKEIIICDSMGNIRPDLIDGINPPLFKYAYLMHFNSRSAQEYVEKLKRDYLSNKYLELNEEVKAFFTMNKFTEEKLKFFEKSFNKSFENVRRIYNE